MLIYPYMTSLKEGQCSCHLFPLTAFCTSASLQPTDSDFGLVEWTTPTKARVLLHPDLFNTCCACQLTSLNLLAETSITQPSYVEEYSSEF